jgi:hypothetical protein
MNTATIISFGNIGKIDAVIRGIAAMTMIGIVLAFDLDSSVSSILAFLSIPTMLFALMRWDPLYRLCDFSTDGDILRA